MKRILDLLPESLRGLRNATLPAGHAIQMAKMHFRTYIAVCVLGSLVISPLLAANPFGSAITFALLGLSAAYAESIAGRGDPVRSMHIFGILVWLIATVALLLLGKSATAAAIPIFAFVPSYAAIAGMEAAMLYVGSFISAAMIYAYAIKLGHEFPLLFPFPLAAQIGAIIAAACAVILPMPALYRSFNEERRRAEQELKQRIRREEELESAQAAIRLANQRLEDFSRSASDGFWETDERHRICYLSRKGARREDATSRWLGRQAWDPALSGDRAAASDWLALKALFESRRAFRDVVLPCYRTDGSVCWISASGIPVRDAEGGFAGFRGATSDVTLRIRGEIELGRAMDAAKSANRAKNQFLASLSHEVRTPLNGILGMASLLEFSDMSAEQRTWLAALSRSGGDLKAMLDRILDFVTLESGNAPFRNDPFNLLEAVEAAIGRHRAEAAAKGISLALEFDESLPHLACGDGFRILQLLRELIHNAVKFTAEGGVVVRARLADGNPRAEKLMVAFEVEDTGCGVHQDRQHEIFESFRQIDGGSNRIRGGNGLGLAICRVLVARMHGTISLESRLAAGSRFSACLPLRSAEETERLEAPEGASILVAESM